MEIPRKNINANHLHTKTLSTAEHIKCMQIRVSSRRGFTTDFKKCTIFISRMNTHNNDGQWSRLTVLKILYSQIHHSCMIINI